MSTRITLKRISTMMYFFKMNVVSTVEHMSRWSHTCQPKYVSSHTPMSPVPCPLPHAAHVAQCLIRVSYVDT